MHYVLQHSTVRNLNVNCTTTITQLIREGQLCISENKLIPVV